MKSQKRNKKKKYFMFWLVLGILAVGGILIMLNKESLVSVNAIDSQELSNITLKDLITIDIEKPIMADEDEIVYYENVIKRSGDYYITTPLETRCTWYPEGHAKQNVKTCNLEIQIDSPNQNFSILATFDAPLNYSDHFNVSTDYAEFVSFTKLNPTMVLSYSTTYTIVNRTIDNGYIPANDLDGNVITNYTYVPTKRYTNYLPLTKQAINNLKKDVLNNKQILLDPTVSACGDIISPGVYTMDQSISAANTCMLLASPNVDFNCANFNITFGAGATGNGIGINTNTSAGSNITIRNCLVIEGNGTSGSSTAIAFNQAFVGSGYNFINITTNSNSTATPASNGILVNGADKNNAYFENITINSKSQSGTSLGMNLRGENITLTNVNINSVAGSGVQSCGITMNQNGNYSNLLIKNSIIKCSLDHNILTIATPTAFSVSSVVTTATNWTIKDSEFKIDIFVGNGGGAALAFGGIILKDMVINNVTFNMSNVGTGNMNGANLGNSGTNATLTNSVFHHYGKGANAMLVTSITNSTYSNLSFISNSAGSAGGNVFNTASLTNSIVEDIFFNLTGNSTAGLIMGGNTSYNRFRMYVEEGAAIGYNCDQAHGNAIDSASNISNFYIYSSTSNISKSPITLCRGVLSNQTTGVHSFFNGVIESPYNLSVMIFDSNASNYFLNVTYPSNDTSKENVTLGFLSRNWYLNVNVSNCTGQAIGANVTSLDNSSVINWSVLTDSNGLIPQQILEDYFVHDNVKSSRNNWTINVTGTGLISNSTQVNLTITQNTNLKMSVACEGGGGGANNTCTYVSGSWVIQCSDYCNITTNVALGGNDLTINGTGITSIIGANITGVNNFYKLGGGTGANMCTLIMRDGGYVGK